MRKHQSWIRRPRFWLLLLICVLPFAGLAMMLRYPSEILSINVQASPAHDVRLTWYLSAGPLQGSGTCEGSGLVGRQFVRAEQMTCVMSSAVEEERMELTMDLRIVDETLYLRLRSVRATSASAQNFDPRFAQLIGTWLAFPMEEVDAEATSASAPPDAEMLHMMDTWFTAEQLPFKNGASYLLHLRRDAWESSVDDLLEKNPWSFDIDPDSIGLQFDMKMDLDDLKRLQFLRFYAHGQAQVSNLAGRYGPIPLTLSLQGEMTARTTPVRVDAPQNPVSLVPTESPLPTVNTDDLAENTIGEDQEPHRGVYSLGAGLYVVVTPTEVILFDAVSNEILRSGFR